MASDLDETGHNGHAREVAAAAREAGLAAGAAPPLRRFPTGEVSAAEAKRAEQPSKGGTLTFSVQPGELVKLIGALLMLGTMWWQLKSDLRDIQTTMSFQVKIQEERALQAQKGLEDLQRKWQLQQYDLGEIKLALAKAGIYNRVVIDGDKSP